VAGGGTASALGPTCVQSRSRTSSGTPTRDADGDWWREPPAQTAALTSLSIDSTGIGRRRPVVRVFAVHGTLTLGRVIPGRALRLFAMANGKVDFFNDTGGYGFISTDDDDVDDDEDVFFHMEDVGGPDLEEGQEVEFDIESSPKGPRATNLVRN
jgi:CspA family cold shock protein